MTGQAPTAVPGRLYTPVEAGEYLGVSRDTVDRLIHQGRLPYVDVGSGTKRKRKRIRHVDLESFVAQTQCEVPAPGTY